MVVLNINKYHFEKGGAETFYFTIGEVLKSEGNNVHYFSMLDARNLLCEDEEYFVRNREYVKKTSIFKQIDAAKNFVYSKEAYKNMIKLINKVKPDIAILSNFHRQLTSSIVDALHENNVKIIWIVHDLISLCPNYQMLDGKGAICEDCCTGNYRNCIKKKCVKNSYLKSYLAVKEAKYNRKHKTYDKIDLFITPSNFYRTLMLKYGFDGKKVVSHKNPLPINTKYELNNHDEKYILFFGRLSKEKGIKTLIDAMKDKNYALKVLGTGPLEGDLKNYIKSNSISNVEFLGFKTGYELANYVRNARCVVLPSEWYENGPYSAMEAMALGKPLIVSNLGGLPELVEDGKNGFIFTKNAELSICLDRMINLDEESYYRMCEDSLAKAKKWFNPNQYVKDILTLLK